MACRTNKQRHAHGPAFQLFRSLSLNLGFEISTAAGLKSGTSGTSSQILDAEFHVGILPGGVELAANPIGVGGSLLGL